VVSPLPTWVLVVSIFISTMIVAFVEVVLLLLIIGRFGYGVHMPEAMGASVVVLVVGSVSFTAMGVAMSTVIPNKDTAGPVTSIVFFVQLFLSGLWFPLRANSGLAQFSNLFPVRHFILAVSAPFEFQPGVSPWAWHDVLIVAVWGAAATAVALRRFRWAPHRG